MEKLIKDDGPNYRGWYGGKNNDDCIYFDNGKLEASTYSYEIGGVGNIRLTEEQTLEIYKKMKKHFERDLLD